MQRGVTAALEIIDELKRGHWQKNISPQPGYTDQLESIDQLI
jgi:hypothetical protein